MIRSTLLTFGLLAHLTAADTLLVPEEYPTIQDAYNNANNGDVISIGEGSHNCGLTISTNGFSSGLTIRGRLDPSDTIIQPLDDGDNTAFHITGSLTPTNGIRIENLTIDGFTTFPTGNNRFGCAVNVATDPTVSLGSSVFVTNVIIQNCSSYGGNYKICKWGKYENCVFENCYTEFSQMVEAGYPNPDSDIEYVTGCTFRKCDAFWLIGTTRRISNCLIEDCILRRPAYGDIDESRVTNCTFLNNSFRETILIARRTIVEDCLFEDNTWSGDLVQNYGTPLFIEDVSGTTLVVRTDFRRNSGLRGGAIMSRGDGTLSYCSFIENTAELLGGAVHVESGTLSTGNISGCGNYPNDFAGLPATCEASGPCCLGTACIELLESNCINNGGEFLDAPCSESTCSSEGACCISGTCSVTTVETCFSLGGSFAGNNTDCTTTDCPSSCEGDISGNGDVGLTDLIAVLSNWGPCPE